METTSDRKSAQGKIGNTWSRPVAKTGKIPARITIRQGSKGWYGPGNQRRVYGGLETQAKPVQPCVGRLYVFAGCQQH